MADMDCNLHNQAVPAGQHWKVKALSLTPENPKCFDAFRALCTEFPTGFVSLKVPNLETLGSFSLNQFWTDGEYILHPRHDMTISDPVLPELSLFAAEIHFPEYGQSKEPAEAFLKRVMTMEIFDKQIFPPTIGIRLSLHLEVWARP